METYRGRQWSGQRRTPRPMRSADREGSLASHTGRLPRHYLRTAGYGTWTIGYGPRFVGRFNREGPPLQPETMPQRKPLGAGRSRCVPPASPGPTQQPNP